MNDYSAATFAVEEDEGTYIQFASIAEISRAWYLATHPEELEETPALL